MASTLKVWPDATSVGCHDMLGASPSPCLLEHLVIIYLSGTSTRRCALHRQKDEPLWHPYASHSTWHTAGATEHWLKK